jgi:hypothetical protein
LGSSAAEKGCSVCLTGKKPWEVHFSQLCESFARYFYRCWGQVLLGVAIGRNPPLAQILPPLVQIAASVPATALFPVLLLALIKTGCGL